MRVHRAFLEEADLRFSVRLLGDAPRGLSPMIKNLRNVSYPRSCFAQPQKEFEILHAIEGGIEARPGGELTPDAKEVADIHDATKIFGGPIWLEERLNQCTGRVFQFVFV